MTNFKRNFRLRLYDGSLLTTQAESAREALVEFGIDPDTVYVEHASGNKAILKFDGKQYILTDLGYA